MSRKKRTVLMAICGVIVLLVGALFIQGKLLLADGKLYVRIDEYKAGHPVDPDNPVGWARCAAIAPECGVCIDSNDSEKPTMERGDYCYKEF